MHVLARFILSILCCGLAANLGGCIAFYTYRPVQISVQDAETQKPIPNVRIQTVYFFMFLLNPPQSTPVTTNSNGQATEMVATYNDRILIATAAGYIRSNPMNVLHDENYHLPHSITIKLYREPLPKITYVIPNGYRGPLKIVTFPPTKDTKDILGKRNFIYHASANGYIAFHPTPFLYYSNGLCSPSWSVIQQDGTLIPVDHNDLPPDTIAVRWLYTGPATLNKINWRELYVIGTQADYNRLHARIFTTIKHGDTREERCNPAAVDALFSKE